MFSVRGAVVKLKEDRATLKLLLKCWKYYTLYYSPSLNI